MKKYVIIEVDDAILESYDMELHNPLFGSEKIAKIKTLRFDVEGVNFFSIIAENQTEALEKFKAKYPNTEIFGIIEELFNNVYFSYFVDMGNAYHIDIKSLSNLEKKARKFFNFYKLLPSMVYYDSYKVKFNIKIFNK